MTLAASDILAAKILIVDHAAATVDVLTQLLRDAGYTAVDSTGNPAEVAALHRRNHYDLILLDLQMPGVDGFQVIETLKVEAAEDWIPVLVITADSVHKLRALQAGARDFISAPFEVADVRARVHNLLEVRLLYRRLDEQNATLEGKVEERTAALRESEARYRSLTEVSSDWYWEQDEQGTFTKVHGPVLEMLGIPVEPLAGKIGDARPDGWNPEQRAHLKAAIANRQPFLDFVFTRANPDGSAQSFRVSGEPMLDRTCRFIGYRGVGVEIPAAK